MGDTGKFSAGHGMSAKKKRPGLRMKEFRSGLGNAQLGAAGIGNQGAWSSMAGYVRKEIDGGANRQRNINQIGIADGWGEFAEVRIVNCAAGMSFANNLSTIPAGNLNVRSEFSQRQGERTANEAGAQH